MIGFHFKLLYSDLNHLHETQMSVLCDLFLPGPPVIDFGKVCLKSTNQKHLNIVNNLNQYIHVVAEVCLICLLLSLLQLISAAHYHGGGHLLLR